MDGGGDSSPVMTDSERRAYRYRQAASRLQGIRKSWSNHSPASSGYGGGRATCVCAPTTHPGSFRCKHHRHAAGASATPTHSAAGHQDGSAGHEAGGYAAPADQEKSSP